MAGDWPDAIPGEVRRDEAAEVDDMWRFVQRKAPHRWFWQAIAHWRGGGRAYACGSRADKVVLEWRKRLKPFGLEPFDTAGAGV